MSRRRIHRALAALTGLLVAGSVRRQTSAHVLRVIEMQQSEERARKK